MPMSFIKKRRINRRYGCKLKEELYNSERLGISIWTDEEVWAVEESEKATKISESKRKFMKFNLPDAIKGLFLLGTEGLFYVDEGKEIKKVYGEEIRGTRIMLTKGIVILFQEEKDVVLQLSQKNVPQIEKMIIGTIKKLGNSEIKDKQKEIFGVSRERLIVIKEGEEESLYTIGIEKKGLHKSKKALLPNLQ